MSFHQNSDNNTGGERESKLKSYMGDGNQEEQQVFSPMPYILNLLAGLSRE